MRKLLFILLSVISFSCFSQITFGVRGNDSIIIFKVGNDSIIEKWDANHQYYGFNPSLIDLSGDLKGIIRTAKKYVDNKVENKKPEYKLSDAGQVTQLTSKATAVTINKLCGKITTFNNALAAGAEVKFTVNNSFVTANDLILLNVVGGGTSGSYIVGIGAMATGFFDVVISNVSTGSLSQAIIINFGIIKLN